MAKGGAAHEIFIRYILKNILILLLPIALSVVYYGISINGLQQAIDSATHTQLSRSMENIDRLLSDMKRMAVSFGNDYEVNYYLSRDNPLTGIEHYNLKQISQKIAPYVFGNAILSHAFIYMEKNGFFVFENGFGRYEEVYDSLFNSAGYTKDLWRDKVLRSDGGERFVPGMMISMGGENTVSHIYQRSIGYGENYLGAIVATIDRGAITRMLSDAPTRYGGWIYVQDSAGNVLASTTSDPNAIIHNLISGSDKIQFKGSDYQVYRTESAWTGWRYTALLNANKVFAGVRAVRVIAFLLIGIGFLVGTFVSYVFAYQNTRPIARVFELILRTGDRSSGLNSVSVYEQVEEAIMVLSNSKRRLENEVKAAAGIARTYFFQNLLRGYYRTREEFDNDRRLFEIEFSSESYYAIICRLASLNAARDGSSLSRFRDSLLKSLHRTIGPGDFVVPVSLDDVVIIRAVSKTDHPRTDARVFLDRMRSSPYPVSSGSCSFGVGFPTSDPFLLILSYNQAAASVATYPASGPTILQFYEDISTPSYSYFYPIDVEESIMKAVRFSNKTLLNSLVWSVQVANFRTRQLSIEQMSYLFIELHGTVLRLLSGLSENVSVLRTRLATWSEIPPSLEKFTALRNLLHEVTAAYDERKKSHNSELLHSVQEYISEHFRNPELSLTVIADVFGKSENYLSNFYKEQTGECLSVVIQRMRFDSAARLLRETGVSIDSIAGQCGYTNVGSFRRAFKRYHGLSPSGYRENSVGIVKEAVKTQKK